MAATELRLFPTAQRRNYRVYVRLNRTEREQMFSAAEYQGVPISEFIRTRCLGV